MTSSEDAQPNKQASHASNKPKAQNANRTPAGAFTPSDRRDQHAMLDDLRQEVIRDTETLPEGYIEFKIAGESESIVIPTDEQIVLGRFAEGTTEVDSKVDLTTYFAFGISRRHALIRRQDDDALAIMDLESKNGTCLNGKHLVPGEFYPINDGDEITLGDLVIQVSM
jgi:hypothetical protein